jgi:hypothetical protein
MAYNIFLYLHSWMRYVVLILLIFSMVKAFSGWQGRKEYTQSTDKLFLFTFIATHIQLLIGLILYFTSPIVTTAHASMGEAMRTIALRFWAVEHLAAMIVAIGLITFGRIRSKKMTEDFKKYKIIAITFAAGLLIMLITIPWPFMMVSRPWFRF